MSSRYTSWGGKVGLCVRQTILAPSCADCLEIWDPQPPGTLRSVQGCSGFAGPTARYTFMTATIRCETWGSHDRHTVFWNVKPSSLVGGYYCFEETRYLVYKAYFHPESEGSSFHHKHQGMPGQYLGTAARLCGAQHYLLRDPQTLLFDSTGGLLPGIKRLVVKPDHLPYSVPR